jgi:tetratricopeptide (TPR) repeat protein
MKHGSVEEIVARIKLWCKHGHQGLARIEWDFVFPRQQVISKLSVDRQVVEIVFPSSGSPFENVEALLVQLSDLRADSVVSITGIEGLVSDAHARLETLGALSFRREELSALPFKQIWWIPTHLSSQIILAVPDLDSWFQLKLYLSEAPPVDLERSELLDDAEVDHSFTLSEARALANRFLKYSVVARRDQSAPLEQIWSVLAKPAYSALTNVGLIADAHQVLDAFSEIVSLPKHEARIANVEESDPDLPKAIDEFALALSSIGDYSQAQRWQELMLARSRSIWGEDDPRTLTAMNNLASTLDDQGHLLEAQALQERVLAVTQRIMGEDHPRTLTAMGNLASTLRLKGDLSTAQTLQERVLSMSRRVLGDHHPNTMAAMNNLAVTLNERHDLTGARALQEEALLSSLELLGPQDLRTLKTRHNLAETLRNQGDLAGARTLQEQILAILRRALGAEHPDTLTAMNNLALTLYSQGDLAGARALQESVLAAMRRDFGEKHLNTLRSMNNLASTLHAQGDLEEARALQEQVLTAIRPLLGRDHPNALTVMSNLARTLRSQGDHTGAAALEEQVQAAISPHSSSHAR